MNLVSKLFVVLNEFLLFIMILLPAPYVLFVLSNGPLTRMDVFRLAAVVLGYYVFVVILFGWLALVIENNRSLKRIVSLLEAQEPTKKKSEPPVRREPTIGVK
jgi:threonine/homoserine/homoserine lactone efflux protein